MNLSLYTLLQMERSCRKTLANFNLDARISFIRIYTQSAFDKNKQEEYYKALSTADKQGRSTVFIEYILDQINEAIKELLDTSNIIDSFETRMGKVRDYLDGVEFSRKDYMKLHKTISSAKASRDLNKAVEMSIISKKGDKRTTKYKF